MGVEGCKGRNVLDDIRATDALTVPVVCSAVFELEFHVLDALVDDPVHDLLAPTHPFSICLYLLDVGVSSILLRSAFARANRTGANRASSCGSRILADDNGSRGGEEEGELCGDEAHGDG